VPIALLTLVKLVLLALLYFFLVRAFRTVLIDLYGPSKRNAPPPRPQVASPSSNQKRSRRTPRELVVHAPNGRPNVVKLNGDSVRFGRAADVTVRVDDAYISDQHAEVLPDGEGGWKVRDLGSTNGTYLNGAKVTQPMPLSNGDQLRIGKTTVEIRR
jgi:pSer/pThr/pTyr-binding forkhead associated (FHA) protein